MQNARFVRARQPIGHTNQKIHDLTASFAF